MIDLVYILESIIYRSYTDRNTFYAYNLNIFPVYISAQKYFDTHCRTNKHTYTVKTRSVPHQLHVHGVKL